MIDPLFEEAADSQMDVIENVKMLGYLVRAALGEEDLSYRDIHEWEAACKKQGQELNKALARLKMAHRAIRNKVKE